MNSGHTGAEAAASEEGEKKESTRIKFLNNFLSSLLEEEEGEYRP